MRLTRAGWGLIAAAVNAVAVGFLFGVTELFLLCAMALSALVFAAVYTVFASPKVEAKRSTNPVKLRSGKDAQLLLELSNLRRRRTPILFAQDLVGSVKSSRLTFGSIDANSNLKVGYSVPTLKRGLLDVGPLTVNVQDPLGLSRKKLKVKSQTQFLVRPSLFVLPPITASTGRLKRSQRTSSRSQGNDDFYALRPYIIGDDLRKVHWRASAKSEDLLIRQDRENRLGAVTIVFDIVSSSYSSEGFERAVGAANSIAHAAQAGGDIVKFYSSDTTTAHEINTKESVELLEEQLALIDPDPEANVARILEPLSRNSVGGTLVVIVGQINPKVEKLISTCRYRHRQIIVLSCETGQKNALSVTFDGTKPLEAVWARAVAVTTK